MLKIINIVNQISFGQKNGMKLSLFVTSCLIQESVFKTDFCIVLMHSNKSFNNLEWQNVL